MEGQQHTFSLLLPRIEKEKSAKAQVTLITTAFRWREGQFAKVRTYIIDLSSNPSSVFTYLSKCCSLVKLCWI